MSIVKKLKVRISNKVREITYLLFSKIENNTWSYLPDKAIRNYIEELNIIACSFLDKEDGRYPIIKTNEITFIGPKLGDDISCAPIFKKKYKRLSIVSGIDVGNLSEEHIGLLHNIVIRYITELSSFPYIPSRTSKILPGDVFVDIGAFRGYVSLKASKKLGKTGKVFCFEPIESNNQLIEIQKEINSFDNLEIIKKAVSLQEEEHISFYRSFNQVNSEIPDHVSNNKMKKIDIDNISVKEVCDLVKAEKTNGVHMSITTNGTEIEISKYVVNYCRDSKIPLKRIVIPILYTEEKFEEHESFFGDYGFSVRKDFPWCIIDKI